MTSLLRSSLPLLIAFVTAFSGTSSFAFEVSTNEIGGKKFTVCRVDLNQDHPRLFLYNDSQKPFRTFEVLNQWLKPRGETLLFGMNAGMYHPDFSPVGLLIIDGKQLAPLNVTNGTGNFYLKPNGVFLWSEQGFKVVETSEYRKLTERPQFATQSGPLLLRDGKIHPVFNPKSTSRFVRNGVGIYSPKVAYFAISEETVTFHEFALLFRDHLHCSNALYLDGLISCLYLREQARTAQSVSLGPLIGISGVMQSK